MEGNQASAPAGWGAILRAWLLLHSIASNVNSRRNACCDPRTTVLLSGPTLPGEVTLLWGKESEHMHATVRQPLMLCGMWYILTGDILLTNSHSCSFLCWKENLNKWTHCNNTPLWKSSTWLLKPLKVCDYLLHLGELQVVGKVNKHRPLDIYFSTCVLFGVGLEKVCRKIFSPKLITNIVRHSY